MPASPSLQKPTKAEARKRLRAIPGGTNAVVPEEDKDRVLEIFDNSDTGNAERLAARFGDRICFVATWGEHLVYTGTHWKRDTKGVQVGRYAKQTVNAMCDEIKYLNTAARKPLEKWRRKSASKGGRHAMIDLLKHEDGIAVEHTDLDVDRWALNVANGTLDLKTCALRPHDPKDLITKHIPVAYKKDAQAPRWRKFLGEVLPDKAVREFVHRFLGYCLTGDVGERMFVIFLGGGCNGKTAFLNAIEAVMGEYATTAAPTLLVAKERESHPTEVADLFQARLATTSETRKGATFDEERVKRLTGSDRLKARRMAEDFWQFEPTHKLLIASNHKPRVKDATDSFWDRVAIVLFNVRIPKSKIDRKLSAKLKEEREGILTWLVEGCRQWKEKGLAPPPGVREATQEYRSEEDIVGRFLAECCKQDSGAFTRMAELMKFNKAWADGLNLYPCSSKELTEKLKAEPFSCTSYKRDGVSGWKGIKITAALKYK